MNTGFFTGNIGRDAELRRANNGDAVANFPLAVEVGTRVAPKTMWVDCSVWGKRAEAVHQYMTKGKRIAVVGRVHQDEYKKRDGTPGFRVQISCNEVEFLGGGRQDGEASQHERHETPKQRPVAQAQQPAGDMDDDIPF